MLCTLGQAGRWWTKLHCGWTCSRNGQKSTEALAEHTYVHCMMQQVTGPSKRCYKVPGVLYKTCNPTGDQGGHQRRGFARAIPARQLGCTGRAGCSGGSPRAIPDACPLPTNPPRAPLAPAPFPARCGVRWHTRAGGMSGLALIEFQLDRGAPLSLPRPLSLCWPCMGAT